MSSSATDADFLSLLNWLEVRIGLTFRPDQHRNTMTTIRRLMKSQEIDDLQWFQSVLCQRVEVLNDLIDELTVGETYFFREHQHFEFVRRHVLPEARERRQAKPVRVWSAGCASGEEAYSIAIVCKQQGIAANVDILATDISPAALEKARRGVFRRWSFRGVASEAAKAYVTPIGEENRLRHEIKDHVRFRTLNLASQTYPSPSTSTCDLDLIMCRNVLIYFGPETVSSIGRQMFECLTPGGWLITASGDPSLSSAADFEVVANQFGVFYRRPQKKLSLPAEPRFEAEFASKRPMTVRRHERSPAGNVVSGAPDRSAVYAKKNVGTSPEKSQITSRLSAAQVAFDSGDPRRAAQLTERSLDDPRACVIHIKAIASDDLPAALEKCRMASERHPLAEELHYLHGVLLADADRSLEALQSVQKSIFLNASSVMAHFLFATLHLRQGQLNSARRHFRTVCELCARGKPNDVLPMSNGETVADVAMAAESQLTRLESTLDQR